MESGIIVVDCSTIVKWFLDEVWMVEARNLRDYYKQGLIRFAAPSLIYAFVTADEKLFNAVNTALPNIIYLANWNTP